MTRSTAPIPSLSQDDQSPIPALIGCCALALCLVNEMGSHPGAFTVYAFVYLAGWLMFLTVLVYRCWRFDRGSLAMTLAALLVPLGIVLLYNCDLSRMLLSLYYAVWCMWAAYRSAGRREP
ncbi:hypothetical protein GSD1FS_0549 [Bifidobacterium sp. GSD1FS]|uniref:Uncharacterized protein n=1 Tax=Bifidobacterium canis TaxID=2610880 RepID=A0A7K1J3U2_9BIFI|nr:hypothetical protein [Bifidobacterium canis]